MRKYILFFGYLMAVALLFFAVDFGTGAVFDKYLFLKKDSKLMHVYNGDSEELVILGASRAAHHYIPSVLEDSLGLSCYNYGMDGQNIFNQYVVASELLNKSRHKPKAAILEVAYIDIEDSPGWNDEKLSNLYLLYKEDPNVKEIIDKGSKSTGYALAYSNLFRYNSTLLSYVRSIVTGVKNDPNNGYAPLESVWQKEVETLENTAYPKYHSDKEHYLRALIEAYLKAGVKLVLYNSPDYRYFTNPALWEDKIASLCSEYGIPFINHEHDSLFMGHKEWFNEPFHLNDKGAHVYSAIVAQEMKQFIQTN